MPCKLYFTVLQGVLEGLDPNGLLARAQQQAMDSGLFDLLLKHLHRGLINMPSAI